MAPFPSPPNPLRPPLGLSGKSWNRRSFRHYEKYPAANRLPRFGFDPTRLRLKRLTDQRFISSVAQRLLNVS